MAAHTLIHSPVEKPIIHKPHSYYDYYSFPLNETDSASSFAKVISCLSLQI